MQSEFEYILQQEFFYAKDGLREPAMSLILVAPSSKHGVHIAKLKQQIMRAFKAQMEENKKHNIEPPANTNTDDSGLSGDVIIQVLYASSVVNFDQLLTDFKSLLTTGCCYIAPVTKEHKQLLTTAHLDDLSFKDLENIMGEYFANFLLFSPSKKSS